MEIQKLSKRFIQKTRAQAISSILVVGLIVFLLVSCSIEGIEKVNSIYEGEWTGTYSGKVDSGIWVMYVDKQGNILGTIKSDLSEIDFGIIGNVHNNGELFVNSGTTSSGAVFTGYMFANESSGTWENASIKIKGEWSGRRNEELE